MASELSAEQIRELMHYDPKPGFAYGKSEIASGLKETRAMRNGAATHGTSVMPGQK
ncbi:hypothetical protein HED54_00305 [Ochrobactrum anthropi ATCC 49188]|nr:hypothetical protein [Brucella anthropi ATCC 49188]